MLLNLSSTFWFCGSMRSFIPSDVSSKHMFSHDDTKLPRQPFFKPRLRAVDFGPLWMFLKGYINQLCGETPTDLHMRVPAPTTNFLGLSVTLTETQRKVVINSPCQLRQDARTLEDWLEMQPQRFIMLGINADSYIERCCLGSVSIFSTLEELVA
jgi:hypothetical protein